MAPSDLVLITGGTGHLGFRVLRNALESGYRVRAVARSEEKAKKLQSHALLQKYSNDDLSFVVVPDFLADGAFNEAVKGVKYIIHVASPLATGSPADADADSYFIQPAVKGTLGVLEAAHRHGNGIERIVITSSMAALFPKNYFADTSKYPDFALSAKRLQTYPEGPFNDTMAKYSASKLAALIRAEEFVETNSPSFDIVHVCPAYIFGRDDLAEGIADFKSGTNGVVLNLALGTPHAPAFMSAWNHVDDCARIHVQSLDPKIKGNQNFVVGQSEKSFSWDDVEKIVAKHFPDAVKDGRLPNDATYKTLYVPFDVKKTIDTFGPLKTFEEAVVSVVGHYLEVIGKDK